MQRAFFSISRVIRPRTVQTVSCVPSNATRSLPARSFPVASPPTWATIRRPPFRMASSSTPQPSPIRFAEGEDTEQVTTGLNTLRQRGWQLDTDGMGITKTYYFKTYFKAVSFVNAIAAESAAKKHHAVMTVRIGSVDVHWTTHTPRGLSQKDVNMADHCERGAELLGAVGQGDGQKCH